MHISNYFICMIIFFIYYYIVYHLFEEARKA